MLLLGTIVRFFLIPESKLSRLLPFGTVASIVFLTFMAILFSHDTARDLDKEFSFAFIICIRELFSVRAKKTKPGH